MKHSLCEIERVEILTLQDNYINLIARDNSEVVQRAIPLKGLEFRNSIQAEHGFSTFISVTVDSEIRSLLFDFGFTDQGAAFNAAALNIDLSTVEAFVLSHGHVDHFGGFSELSKRVDKKNVDFILHPTVFRVNRYMKITDEFKVKFPLFTREDVHKAGARLIETVDPYPFIDNHALFLGQIPRKTDFEKGVSALCYDEAGAEEPDMFEDDTSLVFNVRGKGLVVLSGCAHSGIINTIQYALEVTGITQIFAVMGGFHLYDANPDAVLAPTIKALKAFKPRYIIPTHCTGRDAAIAIEREMPESFILNMSGTKLTFSS